VLTIRGTQQIHHTTAEKGTHPLEVPGMVVRATIHEAALEDTAAVVMAAAGVAHSRAGITLKGHKGAMAVVEAKKGPTRHNPPAVTNHTNRRGAAEHHKAGEAAPTATATGRAVAIDMKAAAAKGATATGAERIIFNKGGQMPLMLLKLLALLIAPGPVLAVAAAAHADRWL